VDLTSQLAEVQGRIRRDSRVTQPSFSRNRLTPSEIRRQVLDEETLLLEYALGDRRSHLWVVSTAGTVAVPWHQVSR
jgi:hypothetical protein